MRLYSYVMSHDTGDAPCFEKGFLTLNGCREDICKKAEPGDYVMGIGRITMGHAEPVLIYFGKVKKRGSNTKPNLIFEKGESYYFGVNAPKVPDGLKYWPLPVRHRFNFQEAYIRKLINFASREYKGKPGRPHGIPGCDCKRRSWT